jgi:hypothetical protein
MFQVELAAGWTCQGLRQLPERFTLLDHLAALLVRVFNAEVTGTRPLQVQSVD